MHSLNSPRALSRQTKKRFDAAVSRVAKNEVDTGNATLRGADDLKPSCIVVLGRGLANKAQILICKYITTLIFAI